MPYSPQLRAQIQARLAAAETERAIKQAKVLPALGTAPHIPPLGAKKPKASVTPVTDKPKPAVTDKAVTAGSKAANAERQARHCQARGEAGKKAATAARAARRAKAK